MPISPLKTIRKKCLECCDGNNVEVKYCRISDCPLWTFRLGHRPMEDDLMTNPEAYKRTFSELSISRPECACRERIYEELEKMMDLSHKQCEASKPRPTVGFGAKKTILEDDQEDEEEFEEEDDE